MTDIRVIVVSAEEGDDGIAEFWCGAELMATTIIDDGQLQLRIESRPDGLPWVVNTASLARGLTEASRQIAAY
jgi:hypothetical protein